MSSDSTIRVLMVGPLPPAIGGMATVISNLAESSLSSRTALSLFDTSVRTNKQGGISESLVSRFRLHKRFGTTLRLHRADFVHIHTCSGLSFFLDSMMLLHARLYGVRGVLHIHGGRFDQFLDGLNPVSRSLARWFARRASAVIVLADEWKSRLAPRLPGASLAVIENGVPVPDQASADTENETLTVAYLGGLSHSKGVADLIEALSLCRTSAKLLLAGEESEAGFVDILKQSIKEHGLDTCVEFLGGIRGDQWSDLLARSDCLALVSYAEGLPMSLLEAMSAGRPVIASRVGAVSDLLAKGGGLLVEAGNIQAIADAIDQLSNTKVRNSMGRKARQRIESAYAIEISAKATFDLYSNCLSGQTASAGQTLKT